MPKILGFAPDADPFTPGVLTDCDNLDPTTRGFKASPSPSDIGVTALAGECYGAGQIIKLDNSRRLFAGTAAALYEWSGSWSDVSDTGGYSLGSGDLWQFAQFGNASLAAAKTETLQASVSGAFAAISGAPKARCVEVSNGFVVVADYDDGTDTPDGWHTSALMDHTDWTPAIATGSQNGRLVETPGPITSLRNLGAYCIAYKAESIYLGRYIGPLWSWDLVSSEFGAASAGCVVKTGNFHVVMGRSEFYIFDGTSARPISKAVKTWFFGTEIDRQYMYKVQSLHNKAASIVRWFYPSRNSGGTLDKWIAYNYETGQWGRGSLNIEATVQWNSGGYTIDGLSALSSTINGLPNIPFDSPFWTSSDEVPAIVDASHTVNALEGESAGMSMTTGDAGADGAYSLLSRVRCRWIKKPASAQMTNFYRNDLDDDLVTDFTVSEFDGNFDALRSSRWHRVKVDAIGDCEVSEIYVDARGEADR